MKFLIVNDCLEDQESIKEKIKLFYKAPQFFIVSTGEEALERVKEIAPEVAIINTRLPKMDGLEACHKIKMQRRGLTKIILDSNTVSAEEILKARQMGADDYCVRTKDNNLLMEAIKKLSQPL